MILIHPTTGAEFDFSDELAEKLLAMPNQGGGSAGGWKRKEVETKSDAGSQGNKSKARKPKAKGKDQQSQ